MENVTIVKYLLVLLTAPIWWPVAKALWVEVNRMLAADGGVFGQPPTSIEYEARRRELAELGDPLVNEPLATGEARAAGRRTFRGKRAPHAHAARAGTAAQGARNGSPPRRPGFR